MSTTPPKTSHPWSFFLQLVFGLLLLCPVPVKSQTGSLHTPGHLQSGADTQGSSYASSGYFDSDSNTLYIVGTTYGRWWTHDRNTDASNGKADDPACFYAVVKMPDLDKGGLMDWDHTQLIGKPNVLEMCHALFVDEAEKRIYLVGNSETPEQSLLGPIFNSGELGAEDEIQIGMIMDFAMPAAFEGHNASDANANQLELQLLGGRVEQAYRINYPIAIAGNPGPDEKLYVATMMTDVITRDNTFEGDTVDPTKVLRYGQQDSILFLREYSKKDIKTNSGLINPMSDGGGPITLDTTLLRGESKEYATNGPPVNVATMLRLPDRLVVGGSTEGVGGKLYDGQGADALNMDGFVAQFDLVSLEPMGATSAQSTFRVASGREDFVTGLCAGDQFSAGHVYVTGYSNGHVTNQTQTDANPDPDSVRGYVMKLRLSDMTPVWIHEFEAVDTGTTTTVRAISCAVAHDGKNVYIAGEIDDGAAIALDASAKPAGMIDIWVAQISSQNGAASDGAVVYVKQMGSDKDDFIAARGGLQVDLAGNAIVIGNTFGEMFRSRANSEDGLIANVFVATFQMDTGEFMLPIDHEDFVTLPPKNTAPPTVAPAPTSSPVAQKEDEDGDGDWIFMMVLLVLGIVGVFAGIIYWNMYRLPRREVPTDRKRVLEYLHDFDVEDIDLKHSATGGWHCSYAGDLAQGINRQTNGGDGVYGAGYRDNSNDPLNRGGRQPTNFQSRGSVTRKQNNEDDPFSIDDDIYTDSIKASNATTFGTSRDARRHGDEASRRDQAKKRWQNREVI